MRASSVRGILIALLGVFLLLPQAQAADPTLDLKAHAGKVVVVDFWASWCKPCRQSIPWLNQMQAKYAARGLVVIGVNVDTERPLADKFLSQTPVRFALVFDAEGKLPQEYQDVLILCDVEEWDAREAAELLERSKAATKSLLYRARQALREQLADLWRDDV